jgi:hypothetical protein
VVQAVTAASSAIDIQMTSSLTVGATYWDVFCTYTATATAMWVARVTSAQLTTGAYISAVGSVSTTAGATAKHIVVGLAGTGTANSTTMFTVNNAYIVTGVTTLDCSGYSKAYVLAKLTVADLRITPALSILPFYQGGNSPTDYFQGELLELEILGAAGQSLAQAFTLDVDSVDGLAILVDEITGQSAAATIYVELA